MKAPVLAAALTSLMAACIGTAGGDTFDAAAYAAGPPDAPGRGAPLSFRTPLGYDVTLSRATLRIGAVYLNELLTPANVQESGCLSSGRYVAEVVSGFDVDLLSPVPQPFPVRGQATSSLARSAEIWLTGRGDVTAPDDSTPILTLEGTASRGGLTRPFRGVVTIGQNRKLPPPTPAQPGANPICRQRIVAPIPVRIVPERGGALVVRVDPRRLFTAIELAELDQLSTDPPLYGFRDAYDDAPSVALYGALRSAPLYTLEWTAPPSP